MSGFKFERFHVHSIISLFAETVCFADQTSTTPSPTTVSTTAVPTQTPPGTPQQGNYTVKDTNDTICLLAKMGLQLNVSYTSQNKVNYSFKRSHSPQKQQMFNQLSIEMKQSVSWVLCFVFLFGQTIQDVLNLNPNVTNSTGLCGASSATLVLTQMQSTILTFNFTLVNLTLYYYYYFFIFYFFLLMLH